MQNQTVNKSSRKRVFTTPCRVVQSKRARSPACLDRDEMRPFIKQIETLKAEKYQLEQKVENLKKSGKSKEQSSSQKTLQKADDVINRQHDVIKTLQEQIGEFQVQVEHKNAKISSLREKRDEAVKALAESNALVMNQKTTIENVELQLAQVQQNAEAIDFAKNMLSDSLGKMISDYEALRAEHVAKVAALVAENDALKGRLVTVEQSCKEGALKIAQTAKSELKKVHEENFRLRKLVESVLENNDGKMTKTVTVSDALKCPVCLVGKNLDKFAVSEMCGHVQCNECTAKLGKKAKSCQTCRGPVTKMVKIYA